MRPGSAQPPRPATPRPSSDCEQVAQRAVAKASGTSEVEATCRSIDVGVRASPEYAAIAQAWSDCAASVGIRADSRSALIDSFLAPLDAPRPAGIGGGARVDGAPGGGASGRNRDLRVLAAASGGLLGSVPELARGGRSVIGGISTSPSVPFTRIRCHADDRRRVDDDSGASLDGRGGDRSADLCAGRHMVASVRPEARRYAPKMASPSEVSIGVATRDRPRPTVCRRQRYISHSPEAIGAEVIVRVGTPGIE